MSTSVSASAFVISYCLCGVGGWVKEEGRGKSERCN